jgi:Flp pilus assembly protein TadG
MKRGRRGNMVLEAAMWMPVFFLLISGIIQFGKITYLYYTLRKIEYTIARSVSIESGVNFCPDASDPIIQGAIEFALTGTTDGSGPPLVENLTAGMISVTTECVDPATGLPGACDTSGCDGAVGAQRPDYVVVAIPDGYQVQLRIPYILLSPFQFKPTVAVPFGGVS